MSERRDQVLAVLQRYWGYDTLRPLQAETIDAVLAGRDSLTVLPTGGGKSICYQVPAAVLERTEIVVSPLISLMKDQVDGLREAGYPAAALYSGLAFEDVKRIEWETVAGKNRLLFVSPERLVTDRFLDLLDRLQVRAFHVDEAHCISHWGHDFRPEYRRLTLLQDRFPQASLHAYTATATERVRHDIVEQLRLRQPQVLVGRFDRPNLIYRIVPRVDVERQVRAAVQRHAGQAVIVYCISRKETESLASFLQSAGVRCVFYHAGMEATQRAAAQDAFIKEDVDVVVATVAFGMGIDRSNVRAVIHAGMPKSIEHYQQETGRAGRDGLEAECLLLYSGADGIRWEQLMERAARDNEGDADGLAASIELLRHMRRFCSSVRCRHRQLTEYFGQDYEKETCGACDVCLDEVDGIGDGTVTAQKILSCVARVEQRFGVEHVVDVLLGADTERVRRWSHEKLSTYALLKGMKRKELTDLVYQLLDDGVLERSADDRPMLRLNEESWRVLRGQRQVKLRVAPTAVKTSKAETTSWEGVAHGLFERLRAMRRELAQERGVPPYVIFSDASLRDIARLRPRTLDELLLAHGVGQKKLADFGALVLSEVAAFEEQG